VCGIAGLICFAATCEDEHVSLVRKMCDLQFHRGPDDNGIVALGNTYLGSTRLSIIDLSDAGHMPMASEDGRWWISYNGEVYNFAHLRQELIRCGHTFRSRTDTEVVLHAFQEWGAKCLDRFVGMFAFAIYDQQTNTMTLVRDRLGIKPLYYMQHEGHVLFSSEMKALVPASNHLKINKQRLIEWSLYRNVDVLSPETLIEDIYAVLPGHLVTITQQEISTQCYYSPTLCVNAEEYERFSHARPQTVVAEIDTAIHQSVKDRLVSDVPVGTLCSGGIDSSLITAVAAQYRREMAGFHVSVSGYPALDERRHAEAVTNHVGARLICYSLSGKAFRRELPRAIYYSDLPLTHPNSVAFFLICQLARTHGITVLLSGEGADELFGGYAWRYRRYRHFYRAQRVLRLLPRKLRKGIELAGYACNGLPGTAHLFDELLPHAVSFLDNYAREEWGIQHENAYEFVENTLDRAVLGVMLADLTDFLTPLLRRLDRMSMGASIESRVPFLDHRLVSKAINLPLSYRIRKRADKWVLKQVASRYLPPHLVNRQKAGFPLPLRDYLAPLAQIALFEKGFCSEVLGLHPRGMQRAVAVWEKHIHAFFSLVSLEIWGRLFIIKEPIEEVNDLIAKLEHQCSH
jgi:asparagine synthase (glutamine-hydrolysing)